MARRVRVAAVAAVAIASLAGCTSTPTQPEWRRIELPDGFVASRLLVVDDRLVVGGATDGGPALLASADAEHPDALRSVAVDATSFYGELALWTSIVADGDTLYALGSRTGGGHGNPRWSTWTGDLDALVEQSAPGVEVFGGWRNGGVAAMAFAAGRPVIVGGRDNGGPGLDIELWFHGDDGWVEQSPTAGTRTSARAATDEVVPFAQGAIGDGARLVVTGYAQHLGDGAVQDVAATWVGPPAGPWTRVDLPADTRESAASSAVCTDAACVITGHGDGALLAWRLDGDTPTALDVPDANVGEAVVPAPVVWGDRLAIVAPDGDGTTIALADVDDLDEWTTVAGPIGHPLATAVVDGRLAVLTEASDSSVTLWMSAGD